MENVLIGKYNISKDKKYLNIKKLNTNDIIEIKLDENIDKAIYDISRFSILDEGSLKGKYVWFSIVNDCPSEVVLDSIPFEGIELEKDYLHIKLLDNKDIFIKIEDFDKIKNNE